MYRLGVGDKLGNRLGRNRWVHHHDVGSADDSRDWRDVADEGEIATPYGPAVVTAEIKRLCKRRTCAQDRPCPAAACARRATSTADGRKSRAERIKRWCRPVLVDAGAGGANLRTSGLLELRTSSLVKHSPENLHLLSDHICGEVTANERRGMAKSIPEISISSDHLSHSRARRSLLLSGHGEVRADAPRTRQAICC